MIQSALHPNTRVIIEAWKRLSGGDKQTTREPMADDHPDLVTRLFVLQADRLDDLIVTSAGSDLEKYLGRDLRQHNFLSIWQGSDRLIVKTAIETAIMNNEPALIRATAETFDRRKTEIEICLSPLNSASGNSHRILGLYQTLGNARAIRQRPIWSHSIHTFHPPLQNVRKSGLRLVANNG